MSGVVSERVTGVVWCGERASDLSERVTLSLSLSGVVSERVTLSVSGVVSERVTLCQVW